MQQKIDVLIVDDERSACEALKGMLMSYCPNVNILGMARSVEEASQLLDELEPDLLFLDIQLGNSTGFDLLEAVGTKGRTVIFTTAYDQFALRAIKFGALDYLLKPIHPDELIAAVEKAVQRPGFEDRISVSVSHSKSPDSQDLNVVLPVSDGFHIATISDIEMIMADRNYSVVHLKSGKTMMVSRSLREWDELLCQVDFLRTHQSYLVNAHCIQQFKSSGRGGVLHLQSGLTAEVARTKKQLVVAYIKSKSVWF